MAWEIGRVRSILGGALLACGLSVFFVAAGITLDIFWERSGNEFVESYLLTSLLLLLFFFLLLLLFLASDNVEFSKLCEVLSHLTKLCA